MPWYIFSIIFLLIFACNQPPSPIPTVRTVQHLVKTATVSPQPLSTTAVYTGSLRAKRFVRIFMQEGGRITHLPYYEGDNVEANALLVQLDDALLKAELDKAIATHKYARLNVQRLQKLAQQHIVSNDELSRAQTELEIAQAEKLILRTRNSYTKITAPFAGIVTARLAEPGDVINANTHILSIIVPSSLIIDVNIPEQLLSQLKRLEPAAIQIDALGTQTYQGYISRIHPTIDRRTRFGHIEIALRSLPKEAQEGQFCRVTLTQHISQQLTLPYSALRRDREGEYVFLLDANSKTQRQAVRSGRRLADRVEILDGLKIGQIVVIKGFLGLQARKTVQVVE